MTSEDRRSSNRILADQLENLEFDDWKRLHEENPEKFDQYRKLILEHQIAMAPESSRQRLRGLMFQMEGEAVLSRSPLGHTMRLSSMMMDMFEELRQQLQAFCSTPDTEIIVDQPPQNLAQVIPFDRSLKQDN